jgi:hypothetical protein
MKEVLACCDSQYARSFSSIPQVETACKVGVTDVPTRRAGWQETVRLLGWEEHRTHQTHWLAGSQMVAPGPPQNACVVVSVSVNIRVRVGVSVSVSVNIRVKIKSFRTQATALFAV